MTDGPMDIQEAPGPEVVPSPPERRPAYTDFRRDGGTAPGTRWGERASATVGRFDGFPVELVELDGRAGVPARAFVVAVDEWAGIDDHDYVLPVVGWGKQPRPWVAAPSGGSLADRAGDASLAEALWTGVCLADALDYAHGAGVVHGALSPAAVHRQLAPVDSGFEWGFPRLGWFGVRHLLRAGTGPYHAPEQAAPERFGVPGPRVDVYGLGLTLYELLTGELPYGGAVDRDDIVGTAPVPPSTVEPTLPAAVDELLRGALAKSPTDRYEDAATFRDRLVELLGAERGTGTETGTAAAAPTRFPLFDGDRAEWRAACPDCGRSVTNTVGSFVAHWRDADRCDGPSETVPARATCSPGEWAAVVARADAAERRPETTAPDRSDHPLWRALAEERVVRIGGVVVRSPDGSYPWLSYPRRGWRVPCPACGTAVYNARSAMKAHWAAAPRCRGPPDDFDTA